MAPMPLENERAYLAPSRPARLFCSASRVGFEERAYAYSSCVFREYVEVRYNGGGTPPVRGSGSSPTWTALVAKRIETPGAESRGLPKNACYARPARHSMTSMGGVLPSRRG